MKIVKNILLLSILLITSISAKPFLMGAGATFPYPLYSKWFDAYSSQHDIPIKYLPIGSGKGYYQLKEDRIDFAGSDIFLNNALIDTLPRPVLHVPMCIGAVGIAYHLPNQPNLKLTPDVLADIFLGQIKKWNDPRIQSLNSNVTLPNLHIIVIHREDVSGTTYVFSQYLSQVSSVWADQIGIGGNVSWPTGLAAIGNTGTSELIHQVNGSIGYLELAHALSNKLPVVALKNKSGHYITPSFKSISEAGNLAIIENNNDLRTVLVNTEAENGYPISAYTWMLLYKEQAYSNRTLEQAKTLVDFMTWAINDGQRMAELTGYGALPFSMQKKATEVVKSMTYNGKPIN